MIARSTGEQRGGAKTGKDPLRQRQRQWPRPASLASPHQISMARRRCEKVRRKNRDRLPSLWRAGLSSSHTASKLFALSSPPRHLHLHLHTTLLPSSPNLLAPSSSAFSSSLHSSPLGLGQLHLLVRAVDRGLDHPSLPRHHRPTFIWAESGCNSCDRQNPRQTRVPAHRSCKAGHSRLRQWSSRSRVPG